MTGLNSRAAAADSGRKAVLNPIWETLTVSSF